MEIALKAPVLDEKRAADFVSHAAKYIYHGIVWPGFVSEDPRAWVDTTRELFCAEARIRSELRV